MYDDGSAVGGGDDGRGCGRAWYLFRLSYPRDHKEIGAGHLSRGEWRAKKRKNMDEIWGESRPEAANQARACSLSRPRLSLTRANLCFHLPLLCLIHWPCGPS